MEGTTQSMENKDMDKSDHVLPLTLTITLKAAACFEIKHFVH